MKKFLIALIAVILSTQVTFCDEAWVNDLRNLFLSNNAIIYVVNLRTFAAQDLNKDGIIDTSEGEESGNFLNAIGRLDELASSGVNTLHLLPIMEVGKTKALGTAGSLYAAKSFDTLNPQLKSERTALSLEKQALKFINEAHKRKIRIIVDLPSCGAYDLYLEHPELFAKDTSGQPIIPADWKDVRLFNAGTENAINPDVYNLYKDFVDYAIKLGADGIRADAAWLKPAKFWKELISYSRRKDPQFMWLAESSDSWTPSANGIIFTPYDKLLEAGFDGFYGSYFNMKDWRNASELINHVKFTNSLHNKFAEQKAVIGSFTTHDEISPVLINGPAYSDMIIWLNSTLPVNAYYVDGFTTGDNYIYLWSNKKARKTFTDDEYYFTHRGKMDIFNFSRKPGGKIRELQNEFKSANSFKAFISPILSSGTFTPLKTTDTEIFAYSMSYNNTTVIVFGNMNFRGFKEGSVFVPHYTDDILTIPIKITNSPISEKGKLKIKLAPGEVQVLLMNGFEVK